MTDSRRYCLKPGGIAMLGQASLPAFLQRAVAAANSTSKKKLVVLFQRGAMDGLNVVVPFGERNYYAMRPTIAIPQPRSGGADAWKFIRGANSRLSRRWVRRIRRVRILTRRILWNPAHRDENPRGMAG